MSKRAVILGAAESGVGAAILALKQGFDVFVSDKGTIKEKYRDELIARHIEFEEGNHSEEKILNADVVIKSPGIPDKAPLIKQLKEQGTPVISEITGVPCSFSCLINGALSGIPGLLITTSAFRIFSSE